MGAPAFSGPIGCGVELDTSSLKGGANGIGVGYAAALLSAGAIVVIGDLDIASGQAFERRHPGALKFVECNVLQWDDQARLFQEAVAFSPHGRIHYVVANAGIFRMVDSVFSYEEEEAPTKPELSTIDINVAGALYTAKLAMHYFIKQNGQTPSASQEDTCLVLISSGAGIHDCLRMPQYSTAKWAIRGLLHGLRRTTPLYGSRVNVITPWAIQTQILPSMAFEYTKSKGVDIATVEDAGQCLLRLLSDQSINGRSLFVTPRKWAPRGYIDLDLEGTEENDLRKEIQFDQFRVSLVEDGLFLQF